VKQHDIPLCQDGCEVSLATAAYLGNDVNHLEAMRLVGFPVAPADAHPSALKIAKLVTIAVGGAGVIREFMNIACWEKIE